MVEEVCMNCKHSDNDLGFISYRCQLIYDEMLADEEHDSEWYDFAKVRSYHECHYDPSRFEFRDVPTFPIWLPRNWVGIAIKVYDRDLVHAVPGWQCTHCGWKIGTSEFPPEKCPKCNSLNGSKKNE